MFNMSGVDQAIFIGRSNRSPFKRYGSGNPFTGQPRKNRSGSVRWPSGHNTRSFPISLIAGEEAMRVPGLTKSAQ